MHAKLPFTVLIILGIFSGSSILAEKAEESLKKESALAKASFGSGCFWCTEAVFERIDGVISVTSGYQGGHKKDPDYKEVSTGKTGHAEVVQVEFDPAKVSYGKLLELFWKSHDPTTPNRQGADVGTQYRSVIFYHDEEQKKTAETSKARVEKSGMYKDPIVTEIVAASTFYPAEDYHQDYFRQNPFAPYSFHIRNKLKKLDKKLEAGK